MFQRFRGAAKWRMIVYSAILLALGIIALIPGGTEKFRYLVVSLLPSPKPTFIDLPANPVERGRKEGTEFHLSIRLLDKIYIRFFAPGDKLRKYIGKARTIFQTIDPRWRKEIFGMSATSGVEPGILMLGNSFLDMGLNASGCRQIHAALPDALYHSHNLDWDNLGGIGNYLVTVFRSDAEKGRLKTVHLAFPGMIGVLDIINEKGVALSFNQVGLSDGETQYPVFIAMRDIAETCPDFASARTRILTLPSGMPFCLGLTDAKSGEMAVFERMDHLSPVIEHHPQNQVITADNSPRGPRSRNTAISAIVGEHPPKDRAELIALLRDPRILLGCNLYSVIFDYRHNCFYLASGTVPAALGTYRKYPLF